MASVTSRLIKQELISPPPFIEDNVHYETIMGSYAYGCNRESDSDVDVYGFCIPPKDIIFPHLSGHIDCFDKEQNRFKIFEKHHVKDSSGKQYDLNIYNIVHYFRLCADGNPNMIDSLFTPANCVLWMTELANHVKENRKLFLSKKCWHTFKGYSFAQMGAINSGRKTTTSKRKESIEKHGYCLKHSYHLVRLLNEIEQILVEGDLDLQRNREQLKSIRRGEWSLEDIIEYFNTKAKQLEKIYLDSSVIPHNVREDEIKQLLIDCLEMHYGDLSSVIYISSKDDKYVKVLNDIRKTIDEIL